MDHMGKVKNEARASALWRLSLVLGCGIAPEPSGRAGQQQPRLPWLCPHLVPKEQDR